MTDAALRLIEKHGLSINETCAVSGFGKTKIYEAISAGQLVARKFGKRTIVLQEDLSRFLTALPVTNAKPLSAPPGRSLKSDRPASVPQSRTVAEQVPAVASKAQPKEVRDRARRINPPTGPVD